MCQTLNHLRVHTEIDVKTDTRSSNKLAGVDCLISEGVCVGCFWILSSEVTEGASTGPGLILNTMTFEWPRVWTAPALSLVDIVDISGVLSTGGFVFVIPGKSQSVLLSYPTHVTRGVCHYGGVLPCGGKFFIIFIFFHFYFANLYRRSHVEEKRLLFDQDLTCSVEWRSHIP